jgi:hypothetical protein
LAKAYAYTGTYRHIASGTAEFNDHEAISGRRDRQMRTIDRDCGSAY